jgi:hypothetical protein
MMILGDGLTSRTLTDGVAITGRNWPIEGDEVSIIAHSSVVLEEGQRYLTFLNPSNIDGRLIARINQDRSISAIPPLGIYFREYDGYTVEQLREIAAEIQSITRAHSLGLIPHSLFAFPTFTNYTLPATRAEFAALAVALYENMTGGEITGRMSFNDTKTLIYRRWGIWALCLV